MRTVPPNIWMLLFRVALLGMFIYIYQWPLEKIHSGAYKENVPIFFIGLMAVTMFPAYILWTLMKVMWVRISIEESKIIFHYLYKSMEVYVEDIEAYLKTVHKTKVNKYNGLFIKLKTGNIIEVSEYNLRSINYIVDFLQDHKVSLRGTKDSWFPYTRKV